MSDSDVPVPFVPPPLEVIPAPAAPAPIVLEVPPPTLLLAAPVPPKSEIKITAPKFEGSLVGDASKLLARHNLHNLDLFEVERIAYTSGAVEYMNVLSKSPKIPDMAN